MNSIQRLFLVVEGQDEGYPNYNSARLHITEADPATQNFKNLFVCSPFFSLNEKGYKEIPVLEDGGAVTFCMIPSVYTHFSDLVNEFSLTNQVWFALGLANLVIIEKPDQIGLADKIIQYLESKNNITAFERWEIYDSKIKNPIVNLLHAEKDVYNLGIMISDKLPMNLKFSVSEYLISVNKFLTASKKFTPHYFKSHERTIDASKDLIHDISFLYGDDSYNPIDEVLQNLGTQDKAEALSNLFKPEYQRIREQLINDRHGRIIQFNSYLSYIYSQAYAGTFPIFDHMGIVRRHSLLGIGSAISALTELIYQLEVALAQLPFENFSAKEFFHEKCPEEYFDLFANPHQFDPEIWHKDKVRKVVIDDNVIEPEIVKVPEDFFNRLSFFSGRLGFREYEFSATAAIQALAESHSLEWHIINYTHEIIHNHVRMILNRLFLIPRSIRSSNFNEYLTHYRNLFIDVLYESDDAITNTKYYDYFILLLFNYCIWSKRYGSLSQESNERLILGLFEGNKRKDHLVPEEKELAELVLLCYRDVTEIFVHVIDFCYIYRRDIDIYIVSIWTSWSTVPAVTIDLKQYVLRSLLVIAVTMKGEISVRFDESKKILIRILSEFKEKDHQVVYDRVLELLESSDDKSDLYYRFSNCVILGDLVYNFFVGNLEVLLDNRDINVLPKDEKNEDGSPASYAIQVGSFQGDPIRSKVRLLLDQLAKEIFISGKSVEDAQVERTSAWLLLSLSSYTP